LALYDADDMLRRLRGTLERLRPVVAELTRRQGMLSDLPHEVAGATTLFAPE
jgi:hypothetical protein